MQPPRRAGPRCSLASGGLSNPQPRTSDLCAAVTRADCCLASNSDAVRPPVRASYGPDPRRLMLCHRASSDPPRMAVRRACEFVAKRKSATRIGRSQKRAPRLRRFGGHRTRCMRSSGVYEETGGSCARRLAGGGVQSICSDRTLRSDGNGRRLRDATGCLSRELGAGRAGSR
jgi:hypothetical protein